MSCGLTAFSNLLQPMYFIEAPSLCCGLTAFSNLLQQQSTSKSKTKQLRLDRIF